jgi:hypothetical protein
MKKNGNKVKSLMPARALSAWISWISSGLVLHVVHVEVRGVVHLGVHSLRSKVQNRMHQKHVPQAGTSLESHDHSCVQKFAFRICEVALKAA